MELHQIHSSTGKIKHSPSLEHVSQAILSAKLPAHLHASYSFHIGAATTAAAAAEIEDSTIQVLRGWKSSLYLLYIRLNPCHMTSLSSTFTQCSTCTSGSLSTANTPELHILIDFKNIFDVKWK